MRRRGSTAKYNKSTTRLTMTKISAIRHRYAAITGMSAYLCLIALIFVIVNLVVDLLYFAVDPRLRMERSTAGH